MNGQALQFYQEIMKLSKKDQNEFKRIVAKLLKVNFITNQKDSDINDYYYITNNFAVLKAYFTFMDCELIIDTSLNIIALYNKLENNNLRLKLNESIILLILRLIYEEKKQDISLNNKKIITFHDIHKKFIQTGLTNRRINKTEFRQILMLFRRFNLIDVIDHNYRDDNSRLVLYPTILYAVSIKEINYLYDKLTSYKK